MKKIGWISYSMAGEVNLEQGRSSGGVMVRMGVMKHLIDLGYEIQFYSSMTVDSEKYLLEKKYKQKHPWISKIKYMPEVIKPEDGLDFLIVENGPGNLLFSNRYHKISNIAYCNNMLRHYEGSVFYFMCDNQLPFVFNTETFYKDFIDNELKYGTPADLTRNKYWAFLSGSSDTEQLQEYFSGNMRSPVAELKGVLPYTYIPYADFTLQFTPRMEIKKDPDIDLCFVGNERGNERAEGIKKFYDIPGVKSHIYGKWSKANKDKFIHAKFFDPITVNEVQPLYNNTRFHIVCGDRNMIKAGISYYPYRVIQSILAGCPVLYQAGSMDPDYISLGKDAEIRKTSEVMGYLRNTSPATRTGMVEKQMADLLDKDRVEASCKRLTDAIEYHLGRASDHVGEVSSRLNRITDRVIKRALTGEDVKKKIKYTHVLNYRKENYDDHRSVMGTELMDSNVKKSEVCTRHYPSPRWSGEILDCSMPLTFDTYNKCSFNCLYCFSYFQKSHSMQTKDYQIGNIEWVDPKSIERLFSLDKATQTPLKQFFPYIEDKKVMQWGGLADQFDMYEKKHGVTLQLLEILKKHNYPLCFSTKGTWWVYDERYRKLFKDQDNWNTKFSIINLDEDLSKRVEIGVPSPMERLRAMKELSKLNKGGVTLRLRPFIIGLTDRNNEHLELLKLAKEYGATAVSTEFFCLEARADDRLLKRYEDLSKILGFDIYDFYKKHSRGSGYRRLNYGLKKKYFTEMEELCKKIGLRYYVSDAHHKEKCHGGSCCGLPKSWNYSRGQFTEALIMARESGSVRFSDISQHLEMYKKFRWVMAHGYNTTSPIVRASRQNQTMYDYFREIWNTPNSDKSPYKYFGGVLKPVGTDEKNDVIYEYCGEK